MDGFLSILHDLETNKSVTSVYFDDMNHNLTGFISAFNNSEIIIAHITPTGLYDGFIYNRICNIRRIDYNSQYEAKIQRLYNLKKQTHYNIDYQFNYESLLEAILFFSLNKHLLLTVEYENEVSISGFIESYNIEQEQVVLNVYDMYANCAGISIINLSGIYSICVDTDFEQDIKLLIG